MATGAGKTRMEANLKIRKDHELFLEAYERPTQIYRFLKARHSLEPLFLQRNLSYMKKRHRTKRRNGISFAKLIQTSQQQQQQDISQEIKSDNHLNLSFKSISKGIDISSSTTKTGCDEEQGGCPMEIEILLCQYKHPTPEALITSSLNSVSCICTSLGKCILPNNNNTNPHSTDDNHSTISIPESVLSWKGSNSSFGTRMLAFQVTPLTKNYNTVLEHGRIRKRQVSNDSTTSVNNATEIVEQQCNGVVVTKETSKHLIGNGVSGKKRNHRTVDPLVERGLNGQLDNGEVPCTKDMLKRLHRKVPGGKTLPLVSERTDNLVVSVPRSALGETTVRNVTLPVCKKRKELATDKLRSRKLNHSLTNKGHDGSTTKNNHFTSTVNTRKRNLNSSTNSRSEDLDTGQPPPTKKPFLVTSSNNGGSLSYTEESVCNGNNGDCDSQGMYFAELVIFDSRQECLIIDGEYQLLLQHSMRQDKMKATSEYEALSSLDKNSLFDIDVVSDIDSIDQECSILNNFTLNFTAKWVPNSPKPRPTEMANTVYELLKLRKSYEGSDNSSTEECDGRTRMPRCSTPCPSKPTNFNFLYKNDTLQQTELKENYTCPWCSLDCKQMYCLLKHMSLCHPRFKFTYNKSNYEGLPCVDVRLDKHYDTVTTSNDPIDSVGKDSIIVRKKPTYLKPTTLVLVNRCKECDFNLSEFSPGRQLSSPELFRTFYNSQTCLPMLLKEADTEEDNSCIEWLKISSMKLVDEFIDVNFGEKQFMKVWNSYMMDHRVLADKQIPQTCIKFAQEKLNELREKNIIYNLMSHMIYMCDIGLVTASIILKVFKIVTSHSSEST